MKWLNERRTWWLLVITGDILCFTNWGLTIPLWIKIIFYIVTLPAIGIIHYHYRYLHK
jgi:hypothetical protein